MYRVRRLPGLSYAAVAYYKNFEINIIHGTTVPTQHNATKQHDSSAVLKGLIWVLLLLLRMRNVMSSSELIITWQLSKDQRGECITVHRGRGGRERHSECMSMFLKASFPPPAG